ncbi:MULTISPECIES: transposase [unclassified Mesorhizobium]|uniref:transposase n=1 Tax=unclassified Mesorhizobium TaxID=325217 RepID=UPI00333688B8
MKLAEALDDRGSFRRFCGFSAWEPTPERTAFVRFRKALAAMVWTGLCSTRSPASSRPKRSGLRLARLSMRQCLGQ